MFNYQSKQQQNSQQNDGPQVINKHRITNLYDDRKEDKKDLSFIRSYKRKAEYEASRPLRGRPPSHGKYRGVGHYRIQQRLLKYNDEEEIPGIQVMTRGTRRGVARGPYRKKRDSQGND